MNKVLSLLLISQICFASDDYIEKQKQINLRFKNTVKVGQCWSHTFSMNDYVQASFINKTGKLENPHILLAAENDVFLFGQPKPDDCDSSFDNSYKCKYWIRAEKLDSMYIFFGKDSYVVKCPKNITVKKIISKASQEEKILYNLEVIK